MDQKKIAKQMIQLNKTAFDNSFKAMSMACEQNEKMAATFLSPANWMPEEGRQVINDWMAFYRTGCDNLKKMADENYAKVESYFEQE